MSAINGSTEVVISCHHVSSTDSCKDIILYSRRKFHKCVWAVHPVLNLNSYVILSSPSPRHTLSMMPLGTLAALLALVSGWSSAAPRSTREE